MTVLTLGGFDGLAKSVFWIFLNSGVCGGVERTDFQPFLLPEDIMVLKGMICNNLYPWEDVVVLKGLFFFNSCLCWPTQLLQPGFIITHCQHF